MDPSAIGGLSFIGSGVLLLLIAAFFFFRTKRFLREAVSAQGTVTGLVSRSGSEGGVVYSPVVQFMTMDGRQIQFQDSLGSNPPRYQVGQMVEVKYSPTNPEKARLASKFRLWFVPGLLGGLGLTFALAGIPWFLSSSGGSGGGGSTDPVAVGVGVPTAIPTNIPGVLPTEVPAGAATGSTLAITDESGPRTSPSTCEKFDVRKGGKVVEVGLSFEGGTLTFTVSKFKGPGAYATAQGVKVGGSFLSGGGVSGAVVFSEGRQGSVNLVKGARVVSGSWSCA